MKKTLLALAALAAVGTVSAQSSVTVFGTLDPSIRSSTVTKGAAGSFSQTFLGNNGQGTSQVSFRGVEDLGGGLKATFMVENDFNSTNGSGVQALGNGGGELYAGLTGGFGTIQLGTPNTPSLTVQASRSPYGTKIGGGFGTTSIQGAQHVRETGSVVYATPDISGFSAKISYTPEINALEAANTGAISGIVTTINGAVVLPYALTATKTDIGLFYANGPLFAGLSFFNQDNAQKQTNLAVNYTFGPAKLFLGYVNQDIGAGAAVVNSSGYNVAVNFNVSPALEVSANVGSLINNTVVNSDRRIATIGAKYSLSNRTSIYTKYVSESWDGAGVTLGASAGAGFAGSVGVTDIKTFLVGVMHNF